MRATKKRATHKCHGAPREHVQSRRVKGIRSCILPVAAFWHRVLPVSRNQEPDMITGVHAGHVEARHVGPAKRPPVPGGVIHVGDGRAGDEAQVSEDAEHVRQLPRAVVGSIHVGGGCSDAGNDDSDVGRSSKVGSEGRDETITLFGRRQDGSQLRAMVGSGQVALRSGGLDCICHGLLEKMTNWNHGDHQDMGIFEQDIPRSTIRHVRVLGLATLASAHRPLGRQQNRLDGSVGGRESGRASGSTPGLAFQAATLFPGVVTAVGPHLRYSSLARLTVPHSWACCGCWVSERCGNQARMPRVLSLRRVQFVPHRHPPVPPA